LLSLALIILATGCSSGPTLTDAQTIWCTDYVDDVTEVAERLSLTTWYYHYYESLGFTYDSEGESEPTDENEALIAERLDNVSSDIDYDAVIQDWYEHPDGIRSCIAAYDSR
jgi:hypothetical protein